MQGMRVLFGSAREELGHLRKNAGREGPSSAVHTLTHPSPFAAATDQHVPTVSSLLFFKTGYQRCRLPSYVLLACPPALVRGRPLLFPSQQHWRRCNCTQAV